MSRKRGIGGIFWGVALIVGGTVFLAKNLGYDVPVWSGIARYWPALLIVWGLIKMVDYYRWQRSGQQGTLFSGGEVALLILVVLGGTVMTAAVNIDPDIGEFFELADIDLWDITGSSFEYMEHLEQDVKSGVPVHIINRYGAVLVTPAAGDRIVVDVQKTVIASDQEEADRLSKTLTYSITPSGDGYQIWSTLNRDVNRVRGRRFKTSLTIQVPKAAALTIDNRSGEVRVSDLMGDQNITNAFGSVTVRGISGGVNVKNNNDTVTIENITGSVNVENEFSAVSVKNVTGRVDLRHRNGQVDVQQVAGAKITTSFGPVYAADINGDLDISARNSSVEVSRASGAVNVRTEFDHVNIVDAKGPVDVRNRNGSVTVSFTQPPTQNVHLTSQFGDIVFETPSNSAFAVDARTRFGSVSTDFDELSQRSDNERSSVAGQVGTGGPEVRLDNRNGSIRIDRR